VVFQSVTDLMSSCCFYRAMLAQSAVILLVGATSSKKPDGGDTRSRNLLAYKELVPETCTDARDQNCAV